MTPSASSKMSATSGSPPRDRGPCSRTGCPGRGRGTRSCRARGRGRARRPAPGGPASVAGRRTRGPCWAFSRRSTRSSASSKSTRSAPGARGRPRWARRTGGTWRASTRARHRVDRLAQARPARGGRRAGAGGAGGGRPARGGQRRRARRRAAPDLRPGAAPVGRARPGHVLLEHDVEVRAAEAVRARRRAPRRAVRRSPVAQLVVRRRTGSRASRCPGFGGVGVEASAAAPCGERETTLRRPAAPGAALQVADVALHRAERDRPCAAPLKRSEALDLDHVARPSWTCRGLRRGGRGGQAGVRPRARDGQLLADRVRAR